jgi:hypothetical protein
MRTGEVSTGFKVDSQGQIDPEKIIARMRCDLRAQVGDISDRLQRHEEQAENLRVMLEEKAAEEKELDDMEVKAAMDSIKDIFKKKSQCRFIEIDGRGVYHYVLEYENVPIPFNLAPELLEAFKSMAVHFIKDVQDRAPSSFLSRPGLMEQAGNMLTADEAIQ